MAVKFRKPAIKFLQKANAEDIARIQAQINQLLTAIEEQGIIPFHNLDIKKMKGEWEGFYRLRIGTTRIIFTANIGSGDLEIYAIGARGDIYK
jgi:mRNA interferase RelE/StbE